MINFIEHFSCEFTDEEKEKCCEVIGWMVEYATKARMWGLLGLESELENGNISTDVLKEGLALIVDAKQSDKVREILLDIMEKGGYAGFDLLKRIIMAEGVLLIQDGYHPVEIAKRLSAILGEQYTSPIEAAERMEEGRKAREKLIDELNESEKASVNNGFENGFSEYGDALWYYLEKMNIENLICALHGCSKSFIVSTIDAAPLELDFEICRRWDEFDGLSDEKISEAMTLVLKEVKALYYALTLFFWKRIRYSITPAIKSTPTIIKMVLITRNGRFGLVPVPVIENS